MSRVRANPPRHVIGIGTADAANVLAIQKRLNAVACGPILEDGVFGQETLDAVEMFQARSVDPAGAHLTIDGIVGPMTWAALFGTVIPSVTTAAAPLLANALVTAAAEIGIREEPAGSNRGPRVDQYLRAIGLNPSGGRFAWCAAFVYWCFQQAASGLHVSNPVIKTAGVLDHWNRAGAAGVRRLAKAEAVAQPSLVQPGMIFIITTASGNGHTGLVEAVRGVVLTTIEGNTNEGGSRDGNGVFRRTTRKISDMRGFLDYAS